jgi:hypothetical protein
MEDQQPPSQEEPRDALRPVGGRDELNLAEFPITLLSDRVPKDCKTLVFEIEPRDKQTGQLVSRKVTITGSDAYGLPTAIDDEILVALIQLTKLKNDFTDATVPFSRYELVKMLGWPDDGKSYQRIEESIKRWAGVTLYYDNAWWNQETRSWVSETFHIIERASFIDQETKRIRKSMGQPELAFSFFKWNEVVFRSFQAGSLKRLDIDAYFSFGSSIAKRMYRFLDKRFWVKPRWEFDLKDFAFEHIGLSRKYDVGQIKNKLQPAIEELSQATKLRAAFIEPMSPEERYEKVGKGQWLIKFVRKIEPSLPGNTSVTKPQKSQGLVAELMARGVSQEVAEELVKTRPPELVDLRIEVFDWVLQQRNQKIIKEHPTGYLISSIRDRYLTVPKGFESKADRVKREEAKRDEQRRAAEATRKRQEAIAAEVEQKAQVEEYLKNLATGDLEQLDREALEEADPEIRASYEQATLPVLQRAQLRIIRESHIRRILGLPELTESS